MPSQLLKGPWLRSQCCANRPLYFQRLHRPDPSSAHIRQRGFPPGAPGGRAGTDGPPAPSAAGQTALPRFPGAPVHSSKFSPGSVCAYGSPARCVVTLESYTLRPEKLGHQASDSFALQGDSPERKCCGPEACPRGRWGQSQPTPGPAWRWRLDGVPREEASLLLPLVRAEQTEPSDRRSFRSRCRCLF